MEGMFTASECSQLLNLNKSVYTGRLPPSVLFFFFLEIQ
jgi:hypothetical protein